MKRSPLARYWHRQRVAAGNAMRRVAGMRFRPLGLLAPIALIATLPELKDTVTTANKA